MLKARRFIPLAALAAAVSLTACQEAGTSPEAEGPAPTLGKSGGDAGAAIAAMMVEMNVALEGDGANYRVAMAEAITAAESGEAGITVLAKNVGNKQLGFDFVPGDGRRAWSSAGGNAITYAIDQTGDAVPPFGGLGAAQTDAAIVRGHNSWEALNCSVLGQTRNPDFGIDIGVVAFIFGLGGSPFVFADVQHAGWRDINFGGGVLGVTFTFGFTSGGVFTDIDNNGKLDAAFREIYYDPSWSWFDDGSSNIDVESVAVHEIGHGLSQAHFGTVAIKNNGNLQRSPFAVMNAIYSQPLQVLQGTDNGGHCSNWAQWPNN
jgi:hypothetical protein